MSPQRPHKKRSYSSVYVIYRRVRFIRYRKKQIKRRLELEKKAELQEKEMLRKQIREFQLTEKERFREKSRVDRLEEKKLRSELKKELKEQKKLAAEELKQQSAQEKQYRKLAAKLEKQQNKRLRKERRKGALKRFFHSFKSINYRNFKRKLVDFRDNAPKRRRFLLISMNSTILFLLSYLSLFLLSQVVTVIAARFFDYPTIVYYYDIYFNINQESWFHDSVKTIFSAGPVFNFVVGISLLIIFSNIKDFPGPFKLFFLWGFLHAVNMLFGALLIGTLFETGVGHVISWLYIMDTGKVLYSIISIFLLVIAGLVATRPFLFSGNTYYNEINEENRTSFITAQVLLPFLMGNLVMLLVRQPRFVFYDTFIGISLILSVLPILITYRSYNVLYFEEDEKKPGISWLAVVLLVFCLLIFRGLLERGIRIGG